MHLFQKAIKQNDNLKLSVLTNQLIDHEYFFRIPDKIFLLHRKDATKAIETMISRASDIFPSGYYLQGQFETLNTV